jgi:hypothetical protein
MAEYIWREAAIKAVEKADYTAISSDADDCKADYLREIIESVPAADVAPVVRCKDCKYQDDCWNCYHPRHHGILLTTYPLDYCSYGEKRDGGESNV